MKRYRICRNEAPHKETWWTVEVEIVYVVKRLWKRTTKTKWETVMDFAKAELSIHWPPYLPTFNFASEAEAQAWIDEAKRPRIHECGEPQ